MKKEERKTYIGGRSGTGYDTEGGEADAGLRSLEEDDEGDEGAADDEESNNERRDVATADEVGGDDAHGDTSGSRRNLK
jgi:hypothetical protein